LPTPVIVPPVPAALTNAAIVPFICAKISGPVVKIAADLWDRYRSTQWMKDWEAREAQGLVFLEPYQPKA
jgi:hypothetical protein